MKCYYYITWSSCFSVLFPINFNGEGSVLVEIVLFYISNKYLLAFLYLHMCFTAFFHLSSSHLLHVRISDFFFLLSVTSNIFQSLLLWYNSSSTQLILFLACSYSWLGKFGIVKFPLI